jgi:hypothetical protein
MRSPGPALIVQDAMELGDEGRGQRAHGPVIVPRASLSRFVLDVDHTYDILASTLVASSQERRASPAR